MSAKNSYIKGFGLKNSAFLQDMTLSFSIELGNRSQYNNFYHITPMEGSVYSLYKEYSHHFFLDSIDDLLRDIVRNVFLHGSVFIYLETDEKNGNLKNWKFEVAHYKFYLKGHHKYYLINNNFDVKTFPLEKIAHISIADFGFTKKELRMIYKALRQSDSLISDATDLYISPKYDFKRHAKYTDTFLLSAISKIYWDNRSATNKYYTVPCVLHQRSKYLQLKLRILNLLIKKLNMLASYLYLRYGIYGQLHYNSQFSIEEIDRRMLQYNEGSINTHSLSNYLYKYN